MQAIDTNRANIALEQADINTARTNMQAEQVSMNSNFGQLEIDIRDANTNGFGPLSPGFLDGFPAGTVQPVVLENATRRVTFDYDVDTDTIINLTYVNKSVEGWSEESF